MRKIPTLFMRNDEDRRHVTREVTPGCDWVTQGLGTGTRKWDGTCVRLHEGEWWARREVKAGKVIPPGFLEVDRDPITHKITGWEPMVQSPFAKFLDEALSIGIEPAPGTYELCGPKINGNPEKFEHHIVLRHGQVTLGGEPRSYDGLREYLANHRMEGVVWWRQPGDPNAGMVKIKAKDFPPAGEQS